MVIYVLNLLNDSLKKIKRKNENPQCGSVLINDARYISRFADIKRSNNMDEINDKIANIVEIIKKYRVSVIDTLNIFEHIIGNKNNIWLIDRIYNGEGNNINECLLSKYIGEIIYSSESISIDDIFKASPNLRRVILDSVFNKIKEENNKAKKLISEVS